MFFVLKNKEKKENTRNMFGSYFFNVLKNMENTKNFKLREKEQF